MKFIDYSIKNTVVVRFMVILLIIGGLFSYVKLGKLEDPEFKIKEALVITLYPEADAHTVELQVTNRVEEALQKIQNIDYLQSVSKPGYSQVKIKLKESVPTKELDQYWDNVRKKIDDAQINMPLGVVPSIVLDDYGAVYGIFLDVTSDGYSYSELSKYTDYILKELEATCEEKIERGKFLKKEIIEKISEISIKINKEISIAVDRNGKTVDINIGDNASAQLPSVEIKEKRLSGIRVIHTHPNGNSKLSDVDISALIELQHLAEVQ